MATNQTTIDILNKIRTEASQEYQNRIPAATVTNLANMGNIITQLDGTKDEFTKAIMDKIAFTQIYDKSYKNPLASLKKGNLPFGKSIENVFVEMSSAKSNFDKGSDDAGVSNADMIFGKESPQMKVEYLSKNRRDFYKCTISSDQVRTAFLSANPIGSLSNAIINQVYSGMEYDEFNIMKELLAKYKENYHLVEVEPIIDGDTNEKACRDFVKTVKKMSKSMSYMKDTFNKQGVKTFTPVKDQVLFINSDVATEVDVELLSKAFNVGNVKVDIPMIEVDDFGSMTDCYALLVDKDFLQIYDELHKTTTQENAVSLYTNYFMHVWQLYGVCNFMNAIMFSTKKRTTT